MIKKKKDKTPNKESRFNEEEASKCFDELLVGVNRFVFVLELIENGFLPPRKVYKEITAVFGSIDSIMASFDAFHRDLICRYVAAKRSKRASQKTTT